MSNEACTAVNCSRRESTLSQGTGLCFTDFRMWDKYHEEYPNVITFRVDMKTCVTCDRLKPARAFPNNRRSCKSCVSVKAKEDRPTTPLAKAKANSKRHGLHPTWYSSKALEQDWKCAICGKQSSIIDEEMLHIDHNHKHCAGATGCPECVRGLLCPGCNQGLGQFKDDPELLLKAIEYLRKFGGNAA